MKEIAISGIYDSKLAKILQRSDSIVWFGDDSDPIYISNEHFIFGINKAHEQTRRVALERGRRLPGETVPFLSLLSAPEKVKDLVLKQPEMTPTCWLVKSPTNNRTAKVLTNGEHVLVIDEQYLSPLDGVTYRCYKDSRYGAVLAVLLAWDMSVLGVILPWLPERFLGEIDITAMRKLCSGSAAKSRLGKLQ